MSITAKDLAAKLGVSPAAISIAVNGRKGISEEKRKLILEAAEEFGLRRDTRKTVSSVIQLVIFKKHGMVFGDTPFFSAVMEGIGAQVAELGYHLQVSYFYASQDHQEQIKSIASADCAGILLLATEMLDGDMNHFYLLNLPIVVLDSFFEDTRFDSVVINNIQGAYQATRHLLDCGHRRLGHLRSNVDINNFQERRYGFKKAIETAPYSNICTHDTVWVGSTYDTAYNDMCKYLSTHSELPTAFFADNDIIATSCMRALKEYGYRIPEDISLVGFDDMPFTYVASPKLTTINVPKEFLGAVAVQKLYERIHTKKESPTTKTCINTTLVVRDSVKICASDRK